MHLETASRRHLKSTPIPSKFFSGNDPAREKAHEEEDAQRARKTRKRRVSRTRGKLLRPLKRRLESLHRILPQTPRCTSPHTLTTAAGFANRCFLLSTTIDKNRKNAHSFFFSNEKKYQGEIR